MNQEKTQVVKSSFWTNFFNSPTERSDLENLLAQFLFFHPYQKKN